MFFLFVQVFCAAMTILSVNYLSRASLYGILNIFTVDLNEETEISGEEKRLILSNFSSFESELISTRLKIYFIQTSKNDDILGRHGCSIESASRLHPHGLIFVLMKSRTVNLDRGIYQRLKIFSNLHFVHFEEENLYRGTNLENLKRNERRQWIRYFDVSHKSDFVRTALLYKYGGIYFDLDVIPLKDFSPFINAVGLESSETVNVAVLVFQRQHLALDIQMDLQIESVKNKFHTFCWNCVGPLALTKSLKNICDEKQFLIHQKEKCHQIDIQPSFVFYPINYQVRLFFVSKGKKLSVCFFRKFRVFFVSR